MAEQWAKDVFTAFSNDARLQNRILDAAHKFPGELEALFGDMAKYVLNATTVPAQAQPAISKKRKLDNGDQPAQNGSSQDDVILKPTVSFFCNAVSFQIPARKKMKLELVADSTDTTRREIRLVDSKSNEIEYTLPNRHIDQIFCLPVPEKQQRQCNFCIIPHFSARTSDGLPYEQMVFTLPETKPADAISSSRTATDEDNYVTFTEPELNQLLQPYGKSVVRPDDNEFASSIAQSHRKGEKAYHVKAHKGTKEGFLFFLPDGILFGFKKPLSFFPFSSIKSISYTSVLQRTFNLIITATEGDSTEAKEVEFSMLDQADFAGIDEYIKRHGLNDASMAADRKAKAYNVNKEPKLETNGDSAHAADDDGQTELQKAEQQLQDEEDEEEEDYEASGGESDGEGEDTDEDEEEYDEEEYDEEYGENVHEEDEDMENAEDAQER